MPFVLIAYPIAFSGIRGRGKILKPIIMLLFFIYFAITTNRYAETLYGVVPYEFGLI